MQDGETTVVGVAAALKASKAVNCSFRMLRSAAVGGYEAATMLLGCLLTRQSQLRPLHLRRPGLPDGASQVAEGFLCATAQGTGSEFNEA